MLKTIAALSLVAFTVSACETTMQSVGLGAAVGAVGASAVGGNVATGAVLGAGVGYVCDQTNGC